MNKKDFPFMNGASAQQGMYMVMEGFDVWATDAQWRRMYKRAHRHGLSLAVEAIDEVAVYMAQWDALYEMQQREEQAMDEYCTAGVDSFLNDMSIMGMISDDYDDACAPMWGTYCMN